MSLYDRVFCEADGAPAGTQPVNPQRAAQYQKDRFSQGDFKSRLEAHKKATAAHLAAGGHPLDGPAAPSPFGTASDPAGLRRGGRVRRG